MDKNNSNYHPTKDIKETMSIKLKGKTICLCLTGSVAIINSPAVARGLMRHGAEIFTVMTKEAKRLIQPTLMEWATGNPVITEITGKIEHILMAGERESSLGFADLILICPTTANTIGKIANGISDTPVTAISTVAIGSKTPFVMVPAMHDSMFRNSIVQENINKIEQLGIDVLKPRFEENKAKVASTQDVVDFVVDKLTNKKDLIGKNFLITAGPAREWIDGVRFISNPSTGKMGIEFGKEVMSRGGKVTIIYGDGTVEAPIGANIIKVDTTQEFVYRMKEEIGSEKFNYLISTAALADFTPKVKRHDKISSDNEFLTIELKSTQKLINLARKLNKSLCIVAFKAEPTIDEEALIDQAYNRLISSKANFIVANNVNRKIKKGFSSDQNEVYVINREKKFKHLKLASKRTISSKILDFIIASPKN